MTPLHSHRNNRAKRRILPVAVFPKPYIHVIGQNAAYTMSSVMFKTSLVAMVLSDCQVSMTAKT